MADIKVLNSACASNANIKDQTDINEFIFKCKESTFLRDECMYSTEVLDCIPDIILLSRSKDPVTCLREYLSSDKVSSYLSSSGLDLSTKEVAHLALLVNASLSMDVLRFEEAFVGYADYIVDATNPNQVDDEEEYMNKIVLNSISNFVCNKPRPTTDGNASNKTAPITKQTNTSTQVAKQATANKVNSATKLAAKKTIEAKSVVTVKTTNEIKAPEASPGSKTLPRNALSLKTKQEPARKITASTEVTTTSSPLILNKGKRTSSLAIGDKKNRHYDLVSIAASLAGSRNIDIDNLKHSFRSVASLKEGTFVKTSLRLRGKKRERYVVSLFPYLEDYMSTEQHDNIINKITTSLEHKKLKGLSNYILDYEVILRKALQEHGAGQVAKVLAIGQKKSSLLDPEKQDKEEKIRYKRQAILHEGVTIACISEIETQIKTCLKQKTNQTKGEIIRGFICDRTRHISKHLENIKTQHLVDMYNRDRNKSTLVFSNRRRYQKLLVNLNLVSSAREYLLEHNTLIEKLCKISTKYSASELLTDAIVKEIEESRADLDIWAIGSKDRLLYQKEYCELYSTYCSKIKELTETISNECQYLTKLINTNLKTAKPIPYLVKVKQNRVRIKDTSDRIKIKGTRKPRRYIILTDEPIADFTTSVSRELSIVKYSTKDKTAKETIESMSELILTLSSSRSVTSEELRSISQILLNTSIKI